MIIHHCSFYYSLRLYINCFQSYHSELLSQWHLIDHFVKGKCSNLPFVSSWGQIYPRYRIGSNTPLCTNRGSFSTYRTFVQGKLSNLPWIMWSGQICLWILWNCADFCSQPYQSSLQINYHHYNWSSQLSKAALFEDHHEFFSYDTKNTWNIPFKLSLTPLFIIFPYYYFTCPNTACPQPL